jgi:hypothetical protein
LDEYTIAKLDSYRVEPVSRSELVEALLTHILKEPEFVNYFVEMRLAEMKRQVALQSQC